jgi:putative transposase
VKFDFIAAKEVAFPVATMCRMLGVSPSGYYACKSRPPSKRVADDARVAAEVAAAHKASRGIYGSPRVHRELKVKGVKVGKKRVERLMNEKGLRGRSKRRFVCTTDSKHDDPIAPNVLDRKFETTTPNEAWVGDVTYIATAEGWLFLAVLLDLFSRRVVGWAISDTNDTKLALAALDHAVHSSTTPIAGAPTPARTTAPHSPREASSRA